jgi:hypothetical protein
MDKQLRSKQYKSNNYEKKQQLLRAHNYPFDRSQIDTVSIDKYEAKLLFRRQLVLEQIPIAAKRLIKAMVKGGDELRVSCVVLNDLLKELNKFEEEKENG